MRYGLAQDKSELRDAYIKVFTSPEGRLVYSSLLEYLAVAHPEEVRGLQTAIKLIQHRSTLPDTRKDT